MRSYVIMSILVALLLFGCVNPPQQGNNTTYQPPTIGAANGTGVAAPPMNNTTAQPAAPSLPPTADIGDNVSVMYSLYVDNKLLDTNNATLANESGIYNPGKLYRPFNFTVEFNKGIIDGFIINVIGMQVNETISFSVEPSRGYGPYDPKKVMVLPRYYEKGLLETVPRSYFEERGLNVSNGTGYDTAFGTVFVQDYNDENVTLYYMLQAGKTFTLNGLPQKVVNITTANPLNQTATIEFMLDVNKTYNIPNPNTGEKTLFQVIDKTDQNITLDSNHPLANKTLDFTVTMLDIKKAK